MSDESGWLFLSLVSFFCLLSCALSVLPVAASSEWPRYCKAGFKSMKEHNYVDAERAFQYAYEIAERDNEPVEIRLECLSNLGRLYAERKDYLMAASTFKRAASLAEKESVSLQTRDSNSPSVVKSDSAADGSVVRLVPSVPPFFSSTLKSSAPSTSPIVQPRVSSSYGLNLGLSSPGSLASLPELKEADYDGYIGTVKRCVRRAWFPPKDATAKAVVIVFTTYRDGHIDEPRVVKSSGSELVDSAAKSAIVAASPFCLLPLGSPESIVVELKLDPNADLAPAVEPLPIGKFRNF